MTEPLSPQAAERSYLWRLHRILALYVLGVLGFLALMTWAEQRGLSRHWIGPIFLFLTVMVYAAIGVYGRTTDSEEYYVAGRRIPPMYNGMAAAADWMSTASFISLAGALYLQGFSGTPDQPGEAAVSRLVIESTLIAGFSKILAEKLIRLCGADTQEVLAAEQPPQT